MYKVPRRLSCNVTDATEDLVVTVKQEDIEGAECGSRKNCVIARALKRRGKGRGAAPWVDVGASVVLVGTSEGSAIRYVLSAVGREQVRFFDTGKNVKRFSPCAVQLMAPPPHLASGARSGPKAASGKTRIKPKSNKPRRPPTR